MEEIFSITKIQTRLIKCRKMYWPAMSDFRAGYRVCPGWTEDFTRFCGDLYYSTRWFPPRMVNQNVKPNLLRWYWEPRYFHSDALVTSNWALIEISKCCAELRIKPSRVWVKVIERYIKNKVREIRRNCKIQFCKLKSGSGKTGKIWYLSKRGFSSFLNPMGVIKKNHL